MFNRGFDFLEKRPDDSLYLTASKITFYIPQDNFVHELSREVGNTVITIASIYVDVFAMDDSDPELFRLNIPVDIQITYQDKTTVVLDFDGEGKKTYIAYTNYRNQMIFESDIHVKSLESAKGFIDVINSGKLNNDIKYGAELLKLYKDNDLLNGINFSVPSTLIEAMLGEMCRDSSDYHIPFRITAGSTGKEQGYSFAKIKSLAQITSVFAALSFENMNLSIINSVNLTRSGRKQTTQPIEKIIHY